MLRVSEDSGVLAVNDKCPVDPSHTGAYMRNYRYLVGDVHCAVCDAYIREFDAS